MLPSLVLALLAPLSVAPDFPKPVDDHVNDFADVLSDEGIAKVKEIARALRAEKGIPIVVVTVNSLADWKASGWSIERYATNLYNEWGIGAMDANQGVLLFVAVKDRKLRIAVGQGFGTTFEAPARSIIDTTIVPRFKRGDYAGGIVAGVEGIAAALRAGPPKEPTSGGEGDTWIPRGTAVGAPIRGVRSHGFPWGWVVVIVLGLFLLSALSSVLRGGSGAWGGGNAPGRGFGGWGGLMTGGIGGFLGSMLYDSVFRGRRSSWGGSSGTGSSSGGPSWGGSSSWGGGSSSFGGGFSSGGGASGSW
jgi:uncharacterized protein